MTDLFCPFCGGETVVDKILRDGYENFRDDPDAYAYFIRCVSCVACGGWAKTEGNAHHNWNMRTPAPVSGAEVTKLYLNANTQSKCANSPTTNGTIWATVGCGEWVYDDAEEEYTEEIVR